MSDKYIIPLFLFAEIYQNSSTCKPFLDLLTPMIEIKSI
jgi:hypothetical protein